MNQATMVLDSVLQAGVEEASGVCILGDTNTTLVKN